MSRYRMSIDGASGRLQFAHGQEGAPLAKPRILVGIMRRGT